MKYFSLGGGEGVGDFMVTISLFQKELASYTVYHHRMKPKVGRNFTSERGGGGQGRSEKYFTSLASRYF